MLHNKPFYRYPIGFLMLTLLSAFDSNHAFAQSIQPASDAVGTSVTQSGQAYLIEGGSLSSSGENLFHSFQDFQLDAAEQATFLTAPSTESVFARINGGVPSVIDGNLQLLGSDADLFLMNPAGIVFGAETTLNLSANFTATTADAIGIGSQWFNAVGKNPHSRLNGPASAFAFASDTPGSIVNTGTLSLNDQQQLMLVGGSVINTGTLSTAGGEITIAAVPGDRTLRISNTGSLLSLDVTAEVADTANGIQSPRFTPLLLPELLTSGNAAEVTNLIENADGTVSLTSFAEDHSSGDEIVVSREAGTAIVAGAIETNSAGQIEGPVTVLGDRTELHPSPPEAANRNIVLLESNEQGTIHQTTQTSDHRNNGRNKDPKEPNGPRDGNRQPDDSQSERIRRSRVDQINSQRGNRNRTDGRGSRPQARMNSRINHSTRTALSREEADLILSELDSARVQEFSDYFGRSLTATERSPEQIQALLKEVSAETDNQSVVVYIKNPEPFEAVASKSHDGSHFSGAELEILIFTAAEDPISITVPGVSQADLSQAIAEFRSDLVTSVRRGSDSYLPAAQQLYQWLIQPIEDELGPEAIDNILFSMDTGLRSVPIAALHDGDQFLIEKYSVGMVPSLSLMDTDYQPVETAQVLAMGASTFETLQSLPGVPTEIQTIGELWQGRQFLNENFTRQNLTDQQTQNPAQIIHLATHADFNEGNAESSYIQLWNERLYLNDIHTLGWDSPPIDLLVLSACQTALGNRNAEMGFAGLSVAAGAKSAVASLWSVSDVGTLALMGEFYSHLQTAPIKSEALRQAQLSMLRKDARLESGQLLTASTRSVVSLPEALRGNSTVDLSHPYYWSGFTMIGNPW